MPGAWLYISLSLPFIRFFIPFFALISRPAKRNLKVIGFMAVWSLVVVYLDLYWIVMPVFYPNGPQIHWLDFATLGATVSITGLVFWSRFRKHAMVPEGDLAPGAEPALRECISHDYEIRSRSPASRSPGRVRP